MNKIWVSGSIAYDRIMNFGGHFADFIDVKKAHVLSLSFLVQDLNMSLGGTAGNIVYGCRSLGLPTGIVGSLGRDGDEYLKVLKKSQCDLQALSLVPSEVTAGAYIITDLDDNQIAGFYAGAMSKSVRLPKAGVKDIAIVAADNPKNMLKLCQYYHRSGVAYIFDPGQQITSLPKPILNHGIKNASVVIGNDYEIALIKKRLIKNSFQKQQIVVSTLGKNGSRVERGGEVWKVKAVKVRKVVDPTGAGDAYRAGFIKGLTTGQSLPVCAQIGATIAAAAVETQGTQNYKISWAILKARHNKTYKTKI